MGRPTKELYAILGLMVLQQIIKNVKFSYFKNGSNLGFLRKSLPLFSFL